MLYCGLDFGTTNTKAVLLDESMRLGGTVSLPIGPQEDSCRLSASIWLEHFYRIIEHFQNAGLIKNEKVALSIAAQGGSFVILDRQFEPISPAYLWTGSSRKETVADLERTFGMDRFYKKTGWEPKGWMPVCKLKDWLAACDDEKKHVSAVTTVPDFIVSRLTGRPVTDITHAQMTGMFDIHTRKWDREILGWCGCELDWMPQVLDSLQVFAEVKVRGVDVSLITSSHDQYAAMRAAGVDAVGEFMLGTGTAWVLNGKSDQPLYDEKHFSIHPGCDLVGNDYGYIATMGAVGQGYDRLLDRLGVSYEGLAGMEAEMTTMPVPRYAIEMDISSGSVSEETKSPLLSMRRYMESAGAQVRFLLEKLDKIHDAKKIVMTGGAASSGIWPAIVAGICNIPVEAVTFHEMTAYGAAVYARMAMGGEISSYNASEDQILRFEPFRVDEYNGWYQTRQRPILERKNENDR